MQLFNDDPTELSRLARYREGIWLLFLLSFIYLVLISSRYQAARADDTHIPVISAETHGLTPLTLDVALRHQVDPRTPTIQQVVPPTIGAGNAFRQQITVSNNEAFSRTITLTQQVPASFIVETLSEEVVWNERERSWRWSGVVAGGDRDYTVVPAEQAVPYIDLADFGVKNLCDDFSEIDNDGVTVVPCHRKQINLNIGQQGQNVLLYGMAWRSLTLHVNGSVTFSEASSGGYPLSPQLMPSDKQGVTLAPLHADYDLSYTKTATATTQVGRWHTAIIADWIDGQDALVVQWHDAPLVAFRTTTVRMALVLPLWKDGTKPPVAETAWFIYDNVSHPSRVIEQGYSIGVQDGAGERGVSYAHSINGDERGHPPTMGALRLLPTRYGDASAAQKTLLLTWRSAAAVPAEVVSTVELVSDSIQQPLSHSWNTQHIAVRHQTFLPLVGRVR